jgi:AraC-like DNA-binding protein
MLNPGWVHMRRTIPETVVILGKKSTALIDDAGDVVEVAPNRLCVLAAGRLHFGHEPIRSPVTYYWLHFALTTPPLVFGEEEATAILDDKDVLKERLGGGALVARELDLNDPEPFNRVFHDLLYEQERPSYSRLKFQLMAQSLLILATEATIKAHASPKSSSPGSSLIYTILSIVAERLSETNMSVKYIADVVNHNPDYIGRQFRKVMGITIGDYILQKRIELATLRLQDTYASITSIAAQCGFGSMRHFLRQFKAVQGLTPTELRARYRAMYINSL